MRNQVLAPRRRRRTRAAWPVVEAIHGTGAAPGVVTGFTLSVAKPWVLQTLAPGTILVVPSASPCRLQLFERAAGVIADDEVYPCSAATLAAELGIPCVTGIRDAVRLVPNGLLVRVDGGTGEISLPGASAFSPAEPPDLRPA